MKNLVLTFLLAVTLPAFSQAPAKKSCSVVPTPIPSEADDALFHNKFEDAERLYTAQAPSPATTAGIVRAQLGQRRLDQALVLIQKEIAAHPNDALLTDVLGEVRYRRGEVVEAAQAYDAARKLDLCLARVWYDTYRYLNFNGLYASAQTQLDTAHKLDPNDPAIKRAWDASQHVPYTAEEFIANLKDRAESPNLTDEQKTALQNSIKAAESHQKGDCQLATPMTSAKIPLFPYNPGNTDLRPPTSSDVDVFFNGKRRRFKLDTGASGILLGADAARALGLTPEAEQSTFGIGDAGRRGTYVTTCRQPEDRPHGVP